MRRAALIGLLASACVGPFASPSPVVSPAPAVPGALAGAGAARTVSFPDCDARSIPGSLPACELLQAALDRDVFVGVLRRASASGITYEARAIELGTGATRVLRPLADLELVIEDVRDAYVLLRETEDFGGGEAHVTLLRIPWRDPARFDVLDEVELVGLRGGDAWNPWPYAKTNGRDVVWLRSGGLSAPHELVILPATGPRRTLFATDRSVYFDIDDSGRVAVARTTTDGSGQDLAVYEAGRLRSLGTRIADQSTEVVIFGDVIGWPRGPGTARPVTEVELVPVFGGASRAARAENACLVVGWAARDLVTVCSSGVRLIDVATGAIRDGPSGRIVLAFRRGLLWRTSADLASNPEVWRITLL